MSDLTSKQRRDLIRVVCTDVKNKKTTPAEAEYQLLSAGLKGFLKPFDVDVTNGSIWPLSLGVLLYCWRDLTQVRQQWERLRFWGFDQLRRDSVSPSQIMALQDAERAAVDDLSIGIVRAFGSDADGQQARLILPGEWKGLSVRHALTGADAVDPDGNVRFSGLFLLRHEVVPLWINELSSPENEVTKTATAEQSSAASRQRSPAGRKPHRAWEDIWIELVRRADLGELPANNKEALISSLQTWATEQGMEDPPGRTALQERVNRLYAALDRE